MKIVKNEVNDILDLVSLARRNGRGGSARKKRLRAGAARAQLKTPSLDQILQMIRKVGPCGCSANQNAPLKCGNADVTRLLRGVKLSERGVQNDHSTQSAGNI